MNISRLEQLRDTAQENVVAFEKIARCRKNQHQKNDYFYMASRQRGKVLYYNDLINYQKCSFWKKLITDKPKIFYYV